MDPTTRRGVGGGSSRVRVERGVYRRYCITALGVPPWPATQLYHSINRDSAASPPNSQRKHVEN